MLSEHAARLLSRRSVRTVAVLVLTALIVLNTARRPGMLLLRADYARLPNVAVQSRGVHAGVPVYTPEQGNQCWDAPRVCTPYLRGGLVFQRLLWSWIVRDPSL